MIRQQMIMIAVKNEEQEEKKMTIKEAAEQFGLTPDTLRFYEKKGLIGPIKKTSGGIRNYDEDDLNRISFIKCMRDAGLPVEVLRQYMMLYDQGDETIEARKALLKEQREILKQKIEKMQTAYEKLNYKVDLFYEGKLEEYLEKTRK